MIECYLLLFAFYNEDKRQIFLFLEDCFYSALVELKMKDTFLILGCKGKEKVMGRKLVGSQYSRESQTMVVCASRCAEWFE